MKLSMTGQMRMEQKMKLAPRMIQSMEILQLPLLALQEKIEQELNSNPVLEQSENETGQDSSSSEQADSEISATSVEENTKDDNSDLC
jgi:RNA polymerase sigma-54 factor